jgi:lipid-binding SYLF domain-containing protein
MRLNRRVVTAIGGLLIATTVFAASSTSDEKRLNKATTVLAEIRSSPYQGIPDEIWDKARCVVVIPSLKKAGFIVGVESGAGVMSCKQANRWSTPIFMQLTKGSAGFQVGAQSTDLVLLVMNQNGVDRLLKNKVTLGGDASIAAGPVGRFATAETDAQMTAEILSYSRSKGVFAGVDLAGGSMRPDDHANERAYGADVSACDIALGTTPPKMSTEAHAFTAALGGDVRATSGTK